MSDRSALNIESLLCRNYSRSIWEKGVFKDEHPICRIASIVASDSQLIKHIRKHIRWKRIHQQQERSNIMPIILWLLGVPLSLVIILWIVGVI
jgi:hypothetical protein